MINSLAGRNGRGGRSGRGRGGKNDRYYFAYMAAKQIEMLFDADSLCMDTYLRSYMDEAGFIPVSIVCSYYNVACYGADYYDVINKIKQLSNQHNEYKIEIDLENEVIRLKKRFSVFRVIEDTAVELTIGEFRLTECYN